VDSAHDSVVGVELRALRELEALCAGMPPGAAYGARGSAIDPADAAPSASASLRRPIAGAFVPPVSIRARRMT
jgi:hypothetical protein